ncbi:perlucin-like protein [Biomphalaria pfeifferi]|uniref:Perlucin-like protein n=1 Tax=Biomphalaria pfeifferi TaxID=112525 RepID=A0AAD8FN36_BIOPF|nr:perlucin-like protein [Biomphalaria pfeifferi]
MQTIRITILFYYIPLFFLVSVNSGVQFNSERPKLDLNFLMEALLEQHKELCDYEWIASGQNERLKALEKVIEAVTSLLFHPSLIYDTKKYVISKFPYQNTRMKPSNTARLLAATWLKLMT